jgi:hypothetical protein
MGVASAQRQRRSEYMATYAEYNPLKQFGNTAKPYTFPSGRTIQMRGYEHLACDALLESFEERDIVCDMADPDRSMPIVPYVLDDRIHHYRPDFYIKSVNKIIEVKSTYFYSGINETVFRQNKQKERAVLALGYKFEWYIYEAKNKRLDQEGIAKLDEKYGV